MHTLSKMNRIAIALVLVLSLVGVAFLATAPPARASHDTIAWSGPTTVASSAGFSYGLSWVVADGHGYVYVFYITENSVTFTANINVTKYAAVGPGGVPQKIFDKQVNDVANVVSIGYPVSATIGANGELYVAWTRIPSTIGTAIYVSRSLNGGVTWQPAVLASDPSSGGSNYWPNVATAPDGTVYISWIQYWSPRYAVTVAKSTDGGVSYSGWTNATSSTYVRSSALAVDGGGRTYIAVCTLNLAVGLQVVNVTWSDNGAAWSPAHTLSAPGLSTIFPELLVDGSGIVHVAWYQTTAGGYSIAYSQSSDRGVSWTGELNIVGFFSGGYIGYLAGEGDTVMYLWGDYDLSGFGYVVSADHGVTWYSPTTVNTGATSLSAVAADQNGTFWETSLDASGHLTLRPWYGPPSRPVIDSVVASGSNGLTVSWTASPEQNVADYRIWRSSDGTNYQAVGLVGGSVTSFTDTGLANGTYYYIVEAINVYGTPSHDSAAFLGVVGPTTAQLIANLQSEITALQAQLAAANASSAAEIAAAQAQITALQSQLTSLRNSEASSNAATAAAIAQLQANLTAVQQKLNDLQNAQATQTLSYANLAFEIIVVVLLVVVLLNQMRKPKRPQLMMAQPGQAEPRKPEDDL